MQRECESCGEGFEAQRSTARFCTATCRSRAARAAKAAAAASTPVEPEADAPAGAAEHTLVSVVRKELAEADALDTVAGQLALQIARRIADPEGAGVSTLSKELRSLLAEAKGAKPTTGDEPPETAPAEDELDKIRRQREEARQAAGLA